MAILEIGRIINNRYRVDGHLGGGGMAEVYKVWDDQRKVYLAMKVLRQDIAQDPIFLRRFQREAQNLAKLKHPNIVRYYGLEREKLLAFLLMEYVDGQGLQAEILLAEGKPLSYKRVLDVMNPICAALHYAHNLDLVHCDIKPGNILVERIGRIVLTDFGIARHMDSATMTLIGAGTPAYMAPELVQGHEPSPQSDIYSLGITLYEMLTGGERPFTGDRATITGSTVEKVRWEHQNLKPEPPSKYNKNISKNIDAIVMRCLEKNPSQRYATISEFIDHLTGKRSPPRQLPPSPPPPPHPQPVVPLWKRWYFWVIIAGIAYLLSKILPPPHPPAPVPTVPASTKPIPTETPDNIRVSQMDGMEMALVPEGTFIMGTEENDPIAYDDEKPVREVYLDAFWIDKTEITNGMYEKCVDVGVCLSQYKSEYHNPNTGSYHFGEAQFRDYPAVYVNWEDASTYCDWADRRLPTEAEWEKAARGLNGYKYPWGNSSPDSSFANFNQNIGDTKPVGSYSKGASPYGALDMAGNVWEWVNDWYDDRYDLNDLDNPLGPSSGKVHVIRGGSFFPDEIYIRTTMREAAGSPETERNGSGNWGFRCAVFEDDL